MPGIKKEFERVVVKSSNALESWLSKNSSREESVWLVHGKKGQPDYVSRGEILEQLLSYGWIDSLARKLDATHTMLLISPRRSRSSWSAVNKRIIERLVKEKRMKGPGLAKIVQAKKDGTWSHLDKVETLEIPKDLESTFKKYPKSKSFFLNFNRSSRRGILEWINAAKQAETRKVRVEKTAKLAGENIMANHPKGRDKGKPLPSSSTRQSPRL